MRQGISTAEGKGKAKGKSFLRFVILVVIRLFQSHAQVYTGKKPITITITIFAPLCGAGQSHAFQAWSITDFDQGLPMGQMLKHRDIIIFV